MKKYILAFLSGFIIWGILLFIGAFAYSLIGNELGWRPLNFTLFGLDILKIEIDHGESFSVRGGEGFLLVVLLGALLNVIASYLLLRNNGSKPSGV
ncbi:hypothetical protein LCL95_01015 [Bacillus timonensis]|nr:hypothetical protein [Bacillus timonensis]